MRSHGVWGIMAAASMAMQCAPLMSSDPAAAASQLGAGNLSASASDEAIIYFEKHVRPLLVNRCYSCHSADYKGAGGLRVDDRRNFFQGGSRGPAAVPGDVENSLILKAVSHTDSKLKMPPEFRLEDEEIAILAKWIDDGAAWPVIEVNEDFFADGDGYERLRKEHWSWQPLQTPAVPVVANSEWSRGDIDNFLLARLESAGLAPVDDADRLTLLRRVTFDLTGLPPSSDEIESFLADRSPDAYEKVVDRLLQSSSFGEHWGRHWLDVARYGESTGSARNLPYPNAWRYRDYVIESFKKDKPYDQFIREQIAGDLLPYTSEDQRHEQQIATAFLAIGVKDVNQRFKVRFTMDNIDEQIDTLSQAFLGLTVSCARCHDHKFDPISTSEYYGIAGIFHSTDHCSGLRNKMGGGGLDYYDTKALIILSEGTQDDPGYAEKVATAKKAADDAREYFESIRDTAVGDELAPNGRSKRQQARQRWNRLQAEYIALTDPAASGKVTHGLRESEQVGDIEIRIRGEAEQLGPVAPRGFLKVIQFEGQPEIPADQSGRLQLAQWITSPENPLTPRVAVNRIWSHLFGTGLVRTVDNFGTMGEKPSHPELLDHLAARFVSEGWSVKQLVRTLVLTRAYQLSSSSTAAHLETDPENRLQWRHSPRRLTAEELRDATLQVGGKLDREHPDGSLAQTLKVIEIRNNGPEAQAILTEARNSRYRSVFLPLLRTLVPTALEAFDFADQGLVIGKRETTTVPTQALYLLNDAFVRKNALSFAVRLLERSDLNDRERVEQAFLVTLGRNPSSLEVDRVLVYLSDYETAAADELNFTSQVPGTEVTAEDSSANDSTGAIAVAQQKAAAAVNPDDVEQTDAPVVEESIAIRDPRTAAWQSFVHALIATAEFRYVR